LSFSATQGAERSRERPVDEGTVDKDIYVVEVVAKDGDAYGDRDAQGADHDESETYPVNP
jgi:hypothetical protein